MRNIEKLGKWKSFMLFTLVVLLIIPITLQVKNVNANAVKFKAGFFTLGDIIIFSYENGLNVSLYNATGALLTSQSLDAGDHYFFHDQPGVYYAVGNKPYSILIGDPITTYVNGYFAANTSYYGVAKEFYTYTSSDHDVIVFAYNNGTTEVTVEEWDGMSWTALSTFTLNDSGDHHRVPRPTWSSKWLHFTSNQSISVQCYSDRCFFVPDESGLWAGTHFYSFAGWYSDGDNIHVHSYVDDNWVKVKYIGGTLIWNDTLNDGEWVNIDRTTIGENVYIEVTSNGTVTVSHEPPWDNDYYGLLAVPDQSGTGVGTKFYTYARESPSGGLGSIWVFAYSDATYVEIKDMDNSSHTLWSGTLDTNEYYQFVPPTGTGGHLFGVFSDNVVSVVEGTGGWGAEFVPLYSAAEAILPTVIINWPTEGETIASDKVTMTYHSPDVDIKYFEVRIDGSTWINNSLNVNYTFTGLSPGTHTLEVRAVNTEEIVGVPDQVSISIVAPTVSIESCNLAGTKKDEFLPDDNIYVFGSGYAPLTNYSIYIVEDVALWTDGMTIPLRISGTAEIVTSDGDGNILPTIAWQSVLTVGNYDIIIDVNGNGVYDAGIDALDDMDISSTGFSVIPELSLSMLLIFSAVTTMALIYGKVKK